MLKSLSDRTAAVASGSGIDGNGGANNVGGRG
jgi:hypothetical protein